MPISIPKINLGIGAKKSHFDFTHDVNTTSDFGFCQPTLFEHVVPNSKIKLKTNSFVRLAPMPTPSFARVEFKTYNTFVPITDVYLAYDYLQSQQTVQSYNKSYIPSKADYINSNMLFRILFNVMVANPLIDMDLSSDYTDTTAPFIPVMWFTPTKKASGIDPAFPLAPMPVNVNAFNDTQFEQLLGNNRNLENIEGISTIGDLKHAFYLGMRQAAAPLRGLEYITPSFENADFFLDTGVTTLGGRFLPDNVEPGEVYITFHATHSGKRLLKVLRTLGYDITANDMDFPLYPLLAYYKGWYDMFNPNRETNWKSTDAYKIIHSYYDTEYSMQWYFTHLGTSYVPICNRFINMLYDISGCCYSLDVDQFTVCNTAPYPASYGNNTDFPYFQINDDTDENVINDNYIGVNTDIGVTGAIGLRWLQKMLPFVSKDSVIGRRVAAYMRAHGLGGHDEERHFMFGSDMSKMQITDLYNVADSEQAALGEYAGKGEGLHEGDYHEFENKEYGFVIQYAVIVPLGGYSQGLKKQPLGRFEFYQKEFDSLGMEAVPSHEVVSDSDDLMRLPFNETFGFRPRFMSYKYKNNLRNGEFFFRSGREQYMPYCLDRYFSQSDVYFAETGTRVKINEQDDQDYPVAYKHDVPAVVPPCHENLRYIGLLESYGNYDRLFYDTSGHVDNFIVHLVQEFHVYSPMLPVSDSFDTFDKLGLNDDTSSMSIEHV